MNTRNFTVKGEITCLFQPGIVPSIDHIEGLEVQLWHKGPLDVILLGSGITNSNGEYNIVFSAESPVSYIVDGKIEHVFIRIFSNGVEIPLPSSYDSDAQLYFDLLNPEPSLQFKEAINKLVLSLKASGNWNKLDRFWIHATEQQQHAKISLIQPESTVITEVNSPSWVFEQGYTGNGTNSYLDTNFNPSLQASHFVLNNGSVFYYSRTNLQENSADIGNGTTGTGANGTAIAPRLSSGQTQVRLQASVNVDGPDFTDTRGLFYVKRIQSDIVTYGRNGMQFGNIAQPQTGIANANFFIGGASWGTVLKFPSTRQIALSGVGSGDVDQYALYLAIQEFATAIGFNV